MLEGTDGLQLIADGRLDHRRYADRGHMQVRDDDAQKRTPRAGRIRERERANRLIGRHTGVWQKARKILVLLQCCSSRSGTPCDATRRRVLHGR
jgi:hypothetical protein